MVNIHDSGHRYGAAQRTGVFPSRRHQLWRQRLSPQDGRGTSLEAPRRPQLRSPSPSCSVCWLFPPRPFIGSFRYAPIQGRTQGEGSGARALPLGPIKHNIFRVSSVNPRPDRGGGVDMLVHPPPPPLRFYADSEKTAALWSTLWGKPCATFGKNKLIRSGQVTEL